MEKTICIIGGDERSKELASILEMEGLHVKVYDEKNYLDIKEFLENVECVVGGIPFSRDGETINAPYIQKKISVENLFVNMKKQKKLIAGGFSEKIKDLAGRYGIELYDFLDDEDFAIYNAIPTAEGAIEIAMKNTKNTIYSSNCLVLGYGRIGKILTDRLKGLHANVTVAARKSEDFAWINAMGYDYVEYSKLDKILSDIDILFNTVPSLVIKEKELSNMKKDSLIIDLASKPGGIDFDFAEKINAKAKLYLGLPGKVAPQSVAKYMLNKVMKVI